MGITFSKKSNRRRIIEPLFYRSRQKYKGPRNSQAENVEMNSLILDLERVQLDLDSVEVSIVEKTNFLIGNIRQITEEEKLNDGPLTDIDGVMINVDNPEETYGTHLEQMSLPNLNILAARASRLESKIKRLEDGI